MGQINIKVTSALIFLARGFLFEDWLLTGHVIPNEVVVL